MKKIITAIVLLVAFATTAYTATAGWQRSIKVEWGYNPPEDVTVVEYRLYQNGKNVCTFPPAPTNVGECVVTLTRAASSFALSVAFADGSESPKSADYIFTDLGTGPALKKMSAK